MRKMWVCEICDKYYQQQKNAEECERRHCCLAMQNFGESIAITASRIYVLGRNSVDVSAKINILAKGLADASKKA